MNFPQKKLAGLLITVVGAFLLKEQIFYFLQIPWWFFPINYFFFAVLARSPEDLQKELEKEGESLEGYKPVLAKRPIYRSGLIHLGRAYNLKYIVEKRQPSIRDIRMLLRSEGWDKYIEEAVRKRHMLVAGTTGSGKTATLFYHIAQDIKRSDLTVIVVDPKGDREFMRRVRKEAEKEGRKFFLFAPHLADEEDVVTWNPLFTCTRPAELAERIFATLEFDEGAKFYADKANLVLQNYSELLMGLNFPKRLDVIFAAIFNVDNFFKENVEKAYKELVDSLQRKGEKIDPNLSLIKTTIENEVAKPYYFEVLQNLQNQLNQIAIQREIAPFINVDHPDLVLRAVMDVDTNYGKKKPVVFFSLPGTSLPKTANAVSRLIVSEVKQTIGWAIQNKKILDTVLYLDEFPVLVFDGIEGLFAMGRAGGIRVVAAFQNISQLEERVGEKQTRAILGNMNLAFIMRQNDIRTAEMFSKMIGQEFFVAQTEQLNKDEDSDLDSLRRFSASEKKDFVFPPHLFLQLREGEGIALLPDGAYFAQVPYLVPEEEKIEEVGEKRLVFEKEKLHA